MKPICLLFVLPLLGTGCRTEQSAYLEKALSQLERIERVAYRRSSESYLPGDTIPRRYLRYYVEQRNRADTTLRHSYLSYYNADDLPPDGHDLFLPGGGHPALRAHHL